MHTIDSSVFFLLSVFDDFLDTILSLYNKLLPNERSLKQTTNYNKTEVTEKKAKTRFDELWSENAVNERLMADSLVCKPNNTGHTLSEKCYDLSSLHRVTTSGVTPLRLNVGESS